MKARQIRRLRREIAKDGYYMRRFERLTMEVGMWEKFYSSKCNSFFVGCSLAERNTYIYDANAPRIIRKADWYKERLTLTKGDLYKYDPRV